MTGRSQSFFFGFFVPVFLSGTPMPSLDFFQRLDRYDTIAGAEYNAWVGGGQVSSAWMPAACAT